MLYLWQLPQNILGLIVIMFSNAKYNELYKVYDTECNFGVSLGKYIIVHSRCNLRTVKHEQGHQKQSLYLGWLYLVVVGLPSATFNLYDRLFHKSWSITKRHEWYYSLLWEKSADKHGGVVR